MMDPERKLLLKRTVVICGVGAVILRAMARAPHFETPLPSQTEQPKTENKEPGSGWYATIYCNNRMPRCGVSDGWVVEVPQRAMTADVSGMTGRDKCELYGKLLAAALDERAAVTVNCLPSRH